jgi:hypothetical protein
MHEIYKNLYVGPKSDYEADVAHRRDWWVVHAAKEPYHRDAVGYSGPDAPPSHPEYLFARRGHRLMLNLIDAPVEVEIPKGIYDAALAFIHEGLGSGSRVLIHCEQGVSRSASIGLLYLRRYTSRVQVDSYAEAEKIYDAIYPPFNPGRAIRYFLRTHWLDYGCSPNNA